MLAAILLEPGRVELREVPTPDPRAGELVVRVDVALTCGTDLKTFRRGHPKIPLPSPMGHEASGVVVAIGAGVTDFGEGDALAWAPSAPCGRCRPCLRGRESLCDEAVGRMAWGAFAEYIRLPRHVVERNTFPRPAGMAPETAAALEPLAAVVHGGDRVRLESAEHVVIVGDGPIALLFLQLALERGAGRVLVAGKHQPRIEAALALGADRVVDVGAERLADAAAEWSGGAGGDVVVECVGLPEAWEAAHGLAAAGGELLAYGGCAAGTRASFDTYRVHYQEVDVKGAFHYAPENVREALDLLRAGRIRIGPLVTHAMPLERIDEALGLALRREAVKVAVQP